MKLPETTNIEMSYDLCRQKPHKFIRLTYHNYYDQF